MMIEYETGQYPEGWETLWAEQAELHRQPVREVVRVVRCKDCKFFERLTSEMTFCIRGSTEEESEAMVMTENDFCSRGERRDSDDTDTD